MKSNEIRDLSEEEIKGKISDWQGELFNLRFQQKMGKLSNALRLRIVRRNIARAQSIMREKQLSSATTTV